MPSDWTDDYFGDLYYESVADLLTSRLSAFEAREIQRLLELRRTDRVLDLACGHGRHARLLAPEVELLVGLDRSPGYLMRAKHSGASLIRGDLRALPLVSGAFDAVFSWYSSLFMYDDPENERVLAEVARVMRAGGRLLVQHANPERLAREPRVRSERALTGDRRVEEDSHYDPATGVDICERRLFRPDGTILSAIARLRYYRPQEWTELATRAGLQLASITSTGQGESRSPSRTSIDGDALDLIAILKKVR
jgi:SAM-dependent methyltransferase